MTDTMGIIKEREAELDALYRRMDKDRDAVYLEAYVLTGLAQFKDKEIPNTVSVTMNDPGVFAQAVSAILQASVRQTVVEGVSDSQAKKIENYIDDILYTGDLGLRKLKKPNLWSHICNHVVIRGPIGARLIFVEGVPTIRPLDMRYCAYADDWVAPHWRRTGQQIIDEYGPVEGVQSIDKRVVVYDFWNPKKNEVWVNGHLARDVKNVYGVTPFAIQNPATGFGLEDEGYEAYQSESCFQLVRNLYADWNRLMSIQLTKAIEVIRPPYVHQSDNVAGPQPPYPHVIASDTPYKEHEKPEPLQVPDINRSFEGASAAIGQALQKGSISSAELGDVSLQRTAIWITEQTEIRSKLLTPRLQCLSEFMVAFAELAIAEIKAINPSPALSFGKAQEKHSYSADDVGNPDEYTIDIKYMPDNKRQKLANYMTGISLKGTLSEDTIIRDIYQCDDPDGEIDKLRAEEARKSSPIVFFSDLAESLLDQAERKTGEESKRLKRKAQIMADQMVSEIKKTKLLPGVPAPGTDALQLKRGSSSPIGSLPALAGAKQ